MGDPIAAELECIVGRGNVLVGAEIKDEYLHDEALGLEPETPRAVVFPRDAGETQQIVAWANATRTALTPRGAGTGLSGACIPSRDGVVVAFERMNAILEIDNDNHVAVIQPGVTLEQLDAETARHRLVYPTFPGELSASLGGNVATNAGGMRAV
ncbi:MAG TPA: FAD-binding oxidoreductase, partial [Acidimicrobiales bacterium]